MHVAHASASPGRDGVRTSLPEALLASERGQLADSILRSCVHCGFCLATCPTYQLLGDERDSPRGRIYLIKNLLEGGSGRTDAAVARPHLDRCLTCRACETTCPSGVQYGRLLEIGRDVVESAGVRPIGSRMARWLLRTLVPRRRLFALAARAGHAVRGVLPVALARRVPRVRAQRRARLPRAHRRRVLLLNGCVQSALTPDVNQALTQVLDRIGITAISTPAETCCGALPLHLGAERQARELARRNVDALWPHVLGGVEAIISTASGCGVTVLDYGQLLAGEPDYTQRAARIAAMTRDVAAFLGEEDIDFETPVDEAIAWHPPCTLQHGQRITGVVEALLGRAGYRLVPVADAHLCCGSAGTYSLLQAELADELATRKLANLTAHAPQRIATANIGCETHLAARTDVPVVHWLELLENASPVSRGTAVET